MFKSYTSSRFAIILSKEHKLAKLIVSCVESLSNHVGVKQTLNEFRNRFLIAQEGSFVKKVVYVKKVKKVKNCFICRKYIDKPRVYPEFWSLPKLRLNYLRPFAVEDVDLCCPIFVKNMYFDRYGRMYKT